MIQRREFPQCYLTVHGAVGVITLNAPASMNAASLAMMAGLLQALDAAEADPVIRALVLTGEGEAFCAGANLNEPSPVRADGTQIGAGERLEAAYHPFLRRLRASRLPLVTAVNGPAVGIGMSFALMGDLIVAARSAFFLQGFSRIGLVPDGGSSWLLPRLVGLARARELALLGEPLPAAKALEWGLINRVAEDDGLMDMALGLAARLAAGPFALAATRRLLWESPGHDHETHLKCEMAAQQEAGASADFKEGLAAFHEKRPPRFTGR